MASKSQQPATAKPRIVRPGFLATLAIVAVGLMLAAVSALRLLSHGAANDTTFRTGLERSPGRTGDVAERLPGLLRLNEPAHRVRAVRLLDALYSDLERIARDLPRDTFDPKAIVDELGNDPERLHAWVRDNTFLVPYRGSLRGPVGVLMDRLGNSLDRSLLLAELLRLGGHEVRLAHRLLSDAETNEALRAIRPMRRRASWRGPRQAASTSAEAEFAETLNELRLVATARDAEMLARFAEAEARVAQQAGVVLGAISQESLDARPERHVADLRDHWWVQRREGDRWSDFDLMQSERAFPNPAGLPDAVIVAAGDGRITLDPGLSHEMTIRVIVEQWDGTRLVEHKVLERAIRPADIIGDEILLRHVPVSSLAEEGASADATLREALIAESSWIPVLHIGRVLVAPAIVDRSGDVIPRTKGAVSGIQRSTGGAAGSMLDALGGGEPPATYLTAEWLEYEVRQPDQEPVTERHEVFDLVGPARRSGLPTEVHEDDSARLRRSLSLLGSIEILPLICDLSPEFMAMLAARQVLSDRSAWLEALGTEDVGRRRALLGSLTHTGVLGPLYSYPFARRRMAGPVPTVFQASVGVVNLRWMGDIDDGGALVNRLVMDVVANPAAALPVGDKSLLPILVRQGVADTAAEDLVLGSPAGPGNTTTIFSQAAIHGVGTAAIRTPSDGRWRSVDVPADVRSRVEHDLDTGFLVVMPVAKVSGRFGWWRVDPRTGATIGVMDSGFRQGETEKVEVDQSVGTATGQLSRQPKVRGPDPRLGDAGEKPLKFLKKIGVDESHPQFKELLDALLDHQEALMKALKYLDKMSG